ncbi:MAG: hypothetical protein IH620_01035 [Ignavibacterium sp.]|nr:hypothetical protein [Ignavibacterium sp.]
MEKEIKAGSKTKVAAIKMGLGISLGIIIGLALKNIAIGLVIGIVVGGASIILNKFSNTKPK